MTRRKSKLKKVSVVKKYPGHRILYKEKEHLSRNGTEICDYLRIPHILEDVIYGFCSLYNKDCMHLTRRKNPTEECQQYQSWLEERRKRKRQ